MNCLDSIKCLPFWMSTLLVLLDLKTKVNYFDDVNKNKEVSQFWTHFFQSFALFRRMSGRVEEKLAHYLVIMITNIYSH